MQISILQGPDVVAYLNYFKKFIELIQAEAGLSCDIFLSYDKYHTDLITAKESNCKSKVYTVETCYTV